MYKIEDDMEILRKYDNEGYHVTAIRKIVPEEERQKNLKRVCDGIVWLQNNMKTQKNVQLS